jgi:type IX secretion system PorP/SprF family membrane protein
MKKILLSGIAGLFMWGMSNVATAQSSNSPFPAFSQYHYTPLLTNPAMVGATNDLQLMFNWRRQQLGAGANFDTPMGSFIYPFFTENREKRRGGIGVSFLSDNSANFMKKTGFSVAGAYNIHIGSNKDNSVAFGVQAGYFQNRIDAQGITTNAQYEGGVFNPDLPVGETIDITSKGNISFSAGVYWNREDEKDREKSFLGLSYMGFNQPTLDFSSVGTTKNVVPGSVQATGGLRVLHTDRFAIMPTVRMLISDAKYQVNVGSWFRYHLSESMKNMLRDGEFGLGLWYNNNNFIVAGLEFNQPHYLLSVSYDIPTRRDIAIINANGILEVTGSFKLNRHHHKQRPSKDTDGDGIFDENDACPQVPGKPEFIGCPDTDNDGIPDDHDNCPQDPGSKEFAGCPDKDKDGIQDSKDQCPEEPGTKETFGCPDKDGDHVADKNDECPDEAGLAIDKGCPKKVAPPTDFKQVDVTDNIKNILKAAKYVHFETGTSKIEKVSNSFLDLVIDILKNNYPDKSIILEGHTDDVGEADKNQTLSVARAESVKAYMVSKGIAPERIITTGKGETVPLHPNDSDENREVNRRVEMQIVEKK